MLQTDESGMKPQSIYSSSAIPISVLKRRELGLGMRCMRFRPQQMCSTLSHSKIMGYACTQCAMMQSEDVFDGSQSVVDVSFSPGGGSYLAVGRTRPTIDILNPMSYKPMWSCRGHSDMVTHLEWIPSTEEENGVPMLVSASTDGTIRLWRRENLVSVLDHTKDWIRHFSVSSASGKILSGDISGKIMLYDLKEERVCSTYKDATVRTKHTYLIYITQCDVLIDH
jgi:WD40 repeat protein